MIPVPEYPVFEPMCLGHQGFFDQAFAKNPPEISEFTFTNLYAWRNAYRFYVARYDDFLIVRSDAKGIPCFLEPIGTGDKRAVMENILVDTAGSFIRIPETVKKIFAGDTRFHVERDAANSDYLYRTDDLIRLVGRKFDGKRNQIKKFKAQYSFAYVELDAVAGRECLDFADGWCIVRDCDGVEGLRHERAAIDDMISHWNTFGLVGGAIKVEQKVCAVAWGQKLNPETIVIHILKADPAMLGLYQVMHHEFVSHHAAGFQFVNMEQDLGIEGLRKSKLSYQPIRLVEKFTIRLT
ncbi:MAG TPA: phosphatidylglycerol lysyltransferase domain-containing protein [Candidatus Omnitrophota bacterium]|nr:phosphatidylglycerol lysyltransferase domain-containing protein [Candidatus Omnitrophota bacterium]HPT06586.1 phosphatidylglycerol lysyltransferase domain-containing protein [Candidatus Omnitrophota bacterium]